MKRPTTSPRGALVSLGTDIACRRAVHEDPDVVHVANTWLGFTTRPSTRIAPSLINAATRDREIPSTFSATKRSRRTPQAVASVRKLIGSASLMQQ